MANLNVKRFLLKGRQVFLRIAEQKDHDRVLHFLRGHFYPFEPFTKATARTLPAPEDEKFELKNINSGASVLAFGDDQEETLLGVLLVKENSQKECRESLEELKNISTHRRYTNELDGAIFMEEIKLRSQIWQRLNIEKGLYLSLVCIRRDFRTFALSQALLHESRQRGVDLGQRIAFGVAVTSMGFKLAQTFGLQPLYTVKYIDYQDYHGRRPFANFPPDETACVCFKTLL